jgi:hypothetical protein
MFQVFHLNVAYVGMVIYVCCKGMFQVFHLNVAYVGMVIYVCCKGMFQVFLLNVAYVAMTIYMHVASACFMLQVYFSNVSGV